MDTYEFVETTFEKYNNTPIELRACDWLSMGVFIFPDNDINIKSYKLTSTHLSFVPYLTYNLFEIYQTGSNGTVV